MVASDPKAGAAEVFAARLRDRFARRPATDSAPKLAAHHDEMGDERKGRVGSAYDRELFRDTLKRLLRSAAVLEFDALDPRELRDHIEGATAASATALLNARS